MASTRTIALFGVFALLQLPAAISDLLSPLFSPVFDDVCKVVDCGKGTCRSTSQDGNSLFECECDRGWKQPRSNHDHGHLKFLPCVVPNCTLDDTCSSAPARDEEEDVHAHANESFFEPCNWAFCGGGICNKTSTFTHRCECNEGYSNLLNITSFPCFKDCAIGMDCSNLGISAPNRSSLAPAMATSDDVGNTACSIQRENFSWLFALVVPLAFVQWS